MRRSALFAAAVAALAAVSLVPVGGAGAAPPVAVPVPPCTGPAGAGGDWAMSGGDLANTRSQAAEDALGPDAAKTLTPVWAAHVGDGGTTGTVNGTPTEANGCVFVGTAAGDVVALSAADGHQIWRRSLTVSTEGLGGIVVASTVVDAGKVIVLVNEQADAAYPGSGPYAVALDERTGAVRWTSPRFETQAGSYTNASPEVVPVPGSPSGRVVFAGWSPAEGDSAGQGGFVLLDTGTGALLEKTTVIPPADQALGYAGGGIWAAPAFADGFGYVGASNPYSKTKEHEHTNAVLKVDLRSFTSPTFGAIVDSYKGNVDQYQQELQALSSTPVCAASDGQPIPYTFDDPACGQLDLDFGAPVNVFHRDGRTLVAALQKAGIVHLIDAADMSNVWSSIVGAPCAACNAAATAVGPDGIAGVSAPGGTAFTLAPSDGSLSWAAPLADGAHYQGTTLADGVFYTTDGGGFLDVFDAATGAVLLKRPLALDTGLPIAGLTSAGIAVARHTVFVAASTTQAAPQGWVIAYRPAPAA